MTKVVIIVLFLQLINLVANFELPDYFPRCYKNDKNLEKCLINATEILKPYLKTGFSEFLIPSLDPLSSEKFSYTQVSPDFQYNGTSSFIVRGLSNYTFESLQYDPRKLIFSGRVICAPVIWEEKFDVKGKVVILPLDGAGTMSAIVGPSASNFTIQGKLVNKNNEIYYQPTKVEIKMDIEDMKFTSFDLNDQNEITDGAIMSAYNSFSEFVALSFTPLLEELAETVVLDYIGRLTNEVPFNKILGNL